MLPQDDMASSNPRPASLMLHFLSVVRVLQGNKVGDVIALENKGRALSGSHLIANSQQASTLRTFSGIMHHPHSVAESRRPRFSAP